MPRRRFAARDLALVAVFAALIAVLGLPGQLTPFGSAVPITAQTLGVMLAGSVLGARRGAAAALVFVALTLAGLPLLAGGRGGLGVLAGPSVGFFLGFVPAAWVTGRLVESWRRGFALGWVLLANVVGGIVVMYALGVPGLAWRSDIPLTTAAETLWIFLPGDLVKAVLAAVVARGVHRGYPVLLPRHDRTEEQPAALP